MSDYEVRSFTWFNYRRDGLAWGVFRLHLGVSTCLFTAATMSQCVDWLRTMKHQRRLS